MALLLAVCAPLAQAETASGAWRQTVFVYGMAVALDGDAQVGPLEVPVDVSLSDFFDSLKFGALAAYRIENGEWSFTGDVTYMNLGTTNRTQGGRATASLDTEQTTVMLTVGRRVMPHLEAQFSMAYFDVEADLRLTVLSLDTTVSRGADWWDPLVGLNFTYPISDKWGFTLRGDIGGFGIGSNLTWHGLTRFTYQQNDRLAWYVGYRAIAYDYEEGRGRDFLNYDLVQHGPGAGVAFSF
jgi:hypothetical protein